MDPTVFVACDHCTLETVIPENYQSAFCFSSGCHKAVILRPILQGCKYVRVVCKEGICFQRVPIENTITKCNSCEAKFDITDEVVEIKNKQRVYGCRKAVTLEEQVKILKTDLSYVKVGLAKQYSTLKKKELELEELKKENIQITNQLTAEQDARKSDEQELEKLKNEIFQLKKELADTQDRYDNLKMAADDKEKMLEEQNRSLLKKIDDLEQKKAGGTAEEKNSNGAAKKKKIKKKSKKSEKIGHQQFGEGSTHLMEATLKFLLVREESSQRVAHERNVDEDAAILFWLFVVDVARDQEKLPHLIQWTSRKEYELKLLNVEGVAELWSERIGTGEIDAKKLLHALRYFDHKKLIVEVEGQENVYRFSENSVLADGMWDTGLTALLNEYKTKKISFYSLFGEEICEEKINVNRINKRDLRSLFILEQEKNAKLEREKKEMKEQMAKLTDINCMLMRKHADVDL